MRFLPWWQGRRISGPAGNRLARFRKVLEVAQAVPIYAASLRSAKLDGKRTLDRITDIEFTLKRLGVFTLEQVRVRPNRGMAAPVVFTSPLSIAATPDLSWNSAGCAILRDGFGTRRTHRALLIRTGLDEGLLSPIERDGLWQRHGVPMFEHLVGMDGALMAWECETHSGLHVIEENVVFELVQGELLLTSLTDLAQPTLQMRTGWSARIETDPCDCGRPGRRLIDLHDLAPRAAWRHRHDRAASAAHS
jgi:hypothetical protein